MQVYSLKHDIINVECLMPGLILAIRRVVRLKVTNQAHQAFYVIMSQAIRFIHKLKKHFSHFSITAEPGVWLGEIVVELLVLLVRLDSHYGSN